VVLDRVAVWAGGGTTPKASMPLSGAPELDYVQYQQRFIGNWFNEKKYGMTD
jgi:hypothetical protein